MPESPQASPLADLERALASSGADRATEAAVRAFLVDVPALEILRSATRVVASRYDPASRIAPHGLGALAAAAGLREAMEPRDHALAVLQAVALAAAEPKLPEPQRDAALVSGEVAHLGRSALLAVRAGDLPDAESVFLGIVEEGWERRMVGEMLFRASAEDVGEGGHKLLTSVAIWRLARALGFREARTILRPAVQYLVNGASAKGPYATMMALLGKESVDLDELASGGKALDDAARVRLAAALATSTDDACVAAVLGLLRDGYAASSIAGGVGVEASKRVLAVDGYALGPAHALLAAHSVRFIVDFSRSSERLYALFQAALGVRSAEPRLAFASVSEPPGPEDAMEEVVRAVVARRPAEAVAEVRLYLALGHPATRLVAVLAHLACLDGSQVNLGHNLLLAQACVEEHAATKAPEFLMALAKSIAASPEDTAASKAWAAALGR